MSMLGTIGTGIGALTAIGGLLKWAYGLAKKVDSTFTYVDELRQNHIPHLQIAVEAIAKKIGVDLPAVYSHHSLDHEYQESVVDKVSGTG